MIHLKMLDRKDASGRNLYELLAPYDYILGVNTVLTVPAGYVTNFGTIPRWAYFLITPEEMREAALLHDFLTNENFTIEGEPFFSGVPRRVADSILYEHMRKLGIDLIRSNIVYAGVRSWAYLTGQVS